MLATLLTEAASGATSSGTISSPRTTAGASGAASSGATSSPRTIAASGASICQIYVLS